jgi:predicted nucleic acid-binding protein
MKGLDTPVLLAILHGTPSARTLLKSLRGEELGTTELNMFELQRLAAESQPPARTARLRALVGLRRRITVVPITAAAVEEAHRGGARQAKDPGYCALMWSAMVEAGCTDWITTAEAAPPRGSTRLRVRIL